MPPLETTSRADLQAFGETLDGLAVAMCVFDDDDRAQAWNRSFLKFFPEHLGHVRVGEDYRDNLRRFFRVRLTPAELPRIETYVEQAVARHHQQQRPMSFEHRGRRLTVNSLPLPAGGRIRLWKEDGAPPQAGDGELAGAELFERIPDGVMVCQADGTILWANGPFAAMYGLPDASAAVGQTFERLYEQAWRAAGTLERTFHEGVLSLRESLHFEGAACELPLPDNRWTRLVAQQAAGGNRCQAHVDITVQKRQQQALERTQEAMRASQAQLRQKSELLEATLERMEQGVILVNAERVVEIHNRAAVELMGIPREMMLRKPRFDEILAYQWSQNEFTRTPGDIQAFVRAGGILDKPHRYDRVRPDGRVIEVQSVPLEGGGVLRTYTDITERKRDEDRIRHVAQHDGLTALVNRQTFHERVDRALAEAVAGGPAFAVHYIDLDGFKTVNDRHGHRVGDRVLVEMASRLKRIARDGDVVGRLGGDEFAVLQYATATGAAALGLAQRMLEGLEEPIDVEGTSMVFGGSIGVALHPGGGDTAEALIASADQAMYAAKAAGGHRATVHQAPD